MDNTLIQESIFPTYVYRIKNPRFLEQIREVSYKFIKKVESQPLVLMTENLDDRKILDFVKFVSQTAWDILDSQGFAMEHFNTQILELWCHQYQPNGYTERHVHGAGSVISGFYFFDCPENCSKVLFHDSRDAKIITSFPEKDINNLTVASTVANYDLHEGMFIFTNSWLPHSFSQNLAQTPLRFVHFNIGIVQAQNHPIEIV